jgi:taurine dioxygenase
MKTEVLDPVGVRVTGLPLREAGSGDVAGLRALLATYGVLVLPGQHTGDGDFVAFLARFGPLVFTQGETPVPGYPDLNVISNVGRVTPPRSVFHVDTSYVPRPPAYTALRAVSIPARGGETLFTNQYRAFDTLPAAVRENLSGRTITHVVTGVDPGEDAGTSAEHPVLRRHPVSGRTALYLTAAQRCAAISGMTGPEAADMVTFLLAHSTRDGNTYRHAWSPGDVVMWDNGCVLHRADHTAVTGDRVMHRGMVAQACR